VVEDEDAVRNLVAGILEKLGYSVLTAENGGEVLRLDDKELARIDLMVTDMVMPGMNGSELAQRMTSIRPGTKVLFMSGYTDNAIAHHGLLPPDTAFLEKPFVPQTLARKVREILDRREP